MEMAKFCHELQYQDIPFDKKKHTCSHSLNLVEVDARHEGFIVKYQCTNKDCQGKSGHEITIESCKKNIPVHLVDLGQSSRGKGLTAGNLRDVLAASLTGHTYRIPTSNTRHARFCTVNYTYTRQPITVTRLTFGRRLLRCGTKSVEISRMRSWNVKMGPQ
jgi:hypothetical protein